MYSFEHYFVNFNILIGINNNISNNLFGTSYIFIVSTYTYGVYLEMNIFIKKIDFNPMLKHAMVLINMMFKRIILKHLNVLWVGSLVPQKSLVRTL